MAIVESLSLSAGRHIHLNAGTFERRDPITRNFWMRIKHRNNNAGDACSDQRVRAGARSACVTAGLQRDISGGPNEIRSVVIGSRIAERVYFCVSIPATLMEATPQDAPTFFDQTTHARIRCHREYAAFGELYCPLQ